MTIYFAGSSVMDFDEFLVGGSYGIDDTTDGVRADQSGSENFAIAKSFASTETTSLWLTFRLYETVAWDLGGDFSLANPPEESTVSIWDGEGNPIFYGGFNPNASSAFQGRVYLRDGSTQDFSEMFPITTHFAGAKYDFHVQPGVGLKVYVNRALAFEYSGNVGNSLSAVNGVGKFGIGNGDRYASPEYRYILAANFDTRFAEVRRVTVNTTPSTDTSSYGDSSLTPAIVVGYNRGTYLDRNNLGFDADGEKVIYPENDTISLTSGTSIAGIVTSFSGFETGAAPAANLTPIVEVGGVEYTGTPAALSTAPTHVQHVFTTNPATSAAWTESDLEGLGYGFSMNT